MKEDDFGLTGVIGAGRPAESATARFEQALAYWQAKRGARPMPSRRDLDPPFEIPHLLPQLVLIEVGRDPLDFRYRLVGTAVTRCAGRDPTGMRFADLPHRQPGSRAWAAALRVATEGKPLLADRAYVGPDPDMPACRDLYLPLSSDGERVDMILGLVEFEAPQPMMPL